ncbi:MAG: aminoacyl-tRNA hydrolase [Chloroflexota bacterium]
MKLIVGLGNPGKEYAASRHNVGFSCVGYFARQHKIALTGKQAHARVGQGEISGIPVLLARPYTFMNQSGKAVKALVKKYGISLEDIIVIHDDMDLPLGKIRLRMGGSSAGHKGINSITSELGSQDFARVRVGIGRPDNADDKCETDMIDYVLSPFTPGEKAVIAEIIPRVSEALLCILERGIDAAMNRFN